MGLAKSVLESINGHVVLVTQRIPPRLASGKEVTFRAIDREGDKPGAENRKKLLQRVILDRQGRVDRVKEYLSDKTGLVERYDMDMTFTRERMLRVPPDMKRLR